MKAGSVPSAAHQLSFANMCPVTEAVATLAEASNEERGAIFTKREVVDFILDLAGYTSDRPLFEYRLLEPSFGDGDFLLPAIDRLLESCKQHRIAIEAALLENAICGVELHSLSCAGTREKVIERLTTHGMPLAQSQKLAAAWLRQGDFLLEELPTGFDFAVGNPPYVRQELIPDALIAEYRLRYRTVFDRADLYIPFIERCLTQLNEGGHLGFICADRWMKNRYGGPLRKMVADNFHLKIYVDMYDTDAFHSAVIAYPAITVIAREKGTKTRIAHRPAINAASLSKLESALLAQGKPPQESGVTELPGVAADADPWILESFDQLAVVRRLEAEFPTLEEAGCKVGIGVATGADKQFIGPFDELDVEPDRKLPLVMTRDILSGEVAWRGLGVINPFSDEGGLVDLAQLPRLKAYLEARKKTIAGRHIATKMPANWYRTIDRIYPALATKPKLLIPDIKGEAHIVFEDGRLYPHHNLYYITAEEWNLKALQAVLLSGIARLFVSIYSTKMRGGYLRFQAQYLRRIRVPFWNQVPEQLKNELIDAAERKDMAACNMAMFRLYGLTAKERAAIGGNGE